MALLIKHGNFELMTNQDRRSKPVELYEAITPYIITLLRDFLRDFHAKALEYTKNY